MDTRSSVSAILLYVAADLLLGLSAAVVKIACKIWLKDSSIASDASADVVDIVKEKVSGELDQRRARRLFEDLEEPVAKKLEWLREHEMAGMPDNEWTAAVLAVGDTLRRATFTDADIFAGDLDPLYLRRKVAAGSPNATRDLSEAGAEVYRRLLTECCAYVVELTSMLPRFIPGAFSEVLRRQSLILQRFGEVLDRMPSAEQTRAGAQRSDADFAAAYRRQVVSQLDRLELYGVTLSDSVRGYPLSTAYIPLSVSGESLRAGDLHLDHPALARSFFFDPDRVASHIRAADPLDGPSNMLVMGDLRQLASLRVDYVLSGASRLFLRGEAGSGKTTLLQWLAVRAARQDFPEWLADGNELVPFLIRLRRYVGKDLPAPEEFLTEVGRHIAADKPQGWVTKLLRDGRALVLIDGADELPEAQRRLARTWLATLVDTYPDAKYVLTSRPGAAASTWLDGHGFMAAEVEPMGWRDVQEFVRHWHDAFRTESGDTDRLTQLAASETTLLTSLHARRHLRLLATSPLLCALLCALNLDRRAQLPGERMELYATALDMLLERRDVERLITSNGAPLSKTIKTLLLEDLAYWLIRSGWSDAPRDRVTERVNRKLAAMPRAGTDDGAAVLDTLVIRSGLIREPVAGRIDFIHRTFEEYLAASAAVSEDQIGELVRNAHDDQWREVIVMAVGRAQPRQRAELLRGILARADAERGKRQLLQALAVACLETSPELDPELHNEIQAVAQSLLPPRGLRQAETLARIGEPLLDLLAERPARGARQAAATIRAASQVGVGAALPIIAAAGKVPGSAVKDELIRAWPFFDAEEYARRVLAGSSNCHYVTVNSPDLIKGLKHIKELKKLGIQFREGHGDLSFMRDLPEIELLNIISDPALHELSPLSSHPSLESVHVQDGESVDLSPLSTLPKLRYVYLRPQNVINLEALADCEQLDHIGVIGPTEVDYLSQIAPANPLKQLDLDWVKFPELAPFTEMPWLANLVFLRLIGCECRSIEGIERLAGTLRELVLWSLPDISSLEPLTLIPGLVRLSLIYGTVQDLHIVRSMPSLRHLYLWSKNPADLTALQGTTSLTVHVERTQKVIGADLLGAGSKVVRG
jgi:hypothetical protein